MSTGEHRTLSKSQPLFLSSAPEITSNASPAYLVMRLNISQCPQQNLALIGLAVPNSVMNLHLHAAPALAALKCNTQEEW